MEQSMGYSQNEVGDMKCKSVVLSLLNKYI